MQRVFMLVKANLRKSRGQNVLLIMLILIISMFCVLSSTLLTGFMTSFNRTAEEKNIPDIFIAGQDMVFRSDNMEILEEDSRVSNVVYNNILYFDNAVITLSGSRKAIPVLAMSVSGHDYTSWEITEKSDTEFENGIYISKYYRDSGGYEIGDRFDIGYDKIYYHFTVAGFFEDCFLGCVHSGAQSGVLFPEDVYETFSEHFSSEESGKIANIYINEPDDAQAVSSSFLNKADTGTAKYCEMTYDVCKNYATMQPSMMAIIMLVFAVILLLISLSVIVYFIRGSLSREVKNISILKSVGYTSREITLSFALQYVLLVFIGSLLGSIISVTFYSYVSDVMQSLTWISMESSINPAVPVVVSFGILLLFFAVSYISAGKLKNISPRKAFDSENSQSQYFGKKFMPLYKSRLSLHSGMALKLLLQNFRQSVLMTVILAVLSFALCYIMILNYNISGDTKKFVDVLMYEYSDITVSVNPTNYEENLDEILASEEQVEDAIFFETIQVQSEDVNLYAYVTEDYSRTKNDSIVYEGRHPQTSDEIAIGGKASEYYNKKIGDVITLDKSGISFDYTITGLIQTSMNSGFDCELVTEGYKRINENFRPNTVFLYMKDGVVLDEFLDYIIQEYQSFMSGASNTIETINQSMGTYVSLVDGLLFGFSIISVIIIWILLYLLIRMRIQKNMSTFGVQKAIGFTSSQIRLEIFLSFLPIMIIGELLGLAITILCSESLSNALFGTMGIMRADFAMPYGMMTGLVILMTVVSLILAMIITDRIKYIAPRSMSA
ncbi:MAG: ABC transporter permease [Ruminococcus flavefaciens]|nr:ABC transporter permease [Ruminococcus flavefaciens]